MLLDTPRGMDDLLPREVALKRRIEDVIREVFKLYGYLEVETPTVEYYELFALKSGEEIRERMFDFIDKGGRRVVLRPEVTASIARLVASKLKAAAPPLRLGYIADCYRYDEPQWGRRRRFWQGGFELIGSKDPLADAEILEVSYEVFNRIGLRDQYFKVGHIGILREILRSYHVDEGVQDRILTLLDRKMVVEAFDLMKENGVDEDGVQVIRELMKLEGTDLRRILADASNLLSPWKEACKDLEDLCEIIDLAREGGVKSRIVVSLGLARGLEYYTGFIFEQSVPDIRIALNGGGRYDNLIELFGGKPTPAVGCAIGITRIMQYILEKKAEETPTPSRPKILLASVGDVSKKYVMRVARILRDMGFGIEVEVLSRKLPSAIEYALKSGMKFMVIVGGREEAEEKISIRDLELRRQIELPLSDRERIMEALAGVERI
ncbi:MAG: histidine--tRNA ligase [Thaumarchaeota archaeon]|nr:MAG: histidine--tRNA ligase [Nitrososphaerota archaeon]